jgi:hypothetical protein
MKKQLSTLLGLGLLLAAASAYAQAIRVKADIPFNFIVGKQTLPAGEYTIQSMDIAGRTLSIRSADQKPLSMIQSNRCEELETAKSTNLIFHRYGDQYFLSQVWVAGQAVGHELPESRQETESAREYSARDVNVTASLR